MMMYDDFIRRVHKHRTNPNLSMQIQKCVDHIEMNLDKKIVAGDLAALVGYTEYYLTHKFKEETGLSVTNYVKFAKVERAKVLLKKHNAQRPGNIRTAGFCHPQLFQRSLSAGHRKNAHGIPGNIKQNRHPALPFGGIGQDACFAMMKKNGGRMAQLRNFSFRVTPKSWAMARRSSSVMVCRMMPPPMESTLT